MIGSSLLLMAYDLDGFGFRHDHAQLTGRQRLYSMVRGPDTLLQQVLAPLHLQLIPLMHQYLVLVEQTAVLVCRENDRHGTGHYSQGQAGDQQHGHQQLSTTDDARCLVARCGARQQPLLQSLQARLPKRGRQPVRPGKTELHASLMAARMTALRALGFWFNSSLPARTAFPADLRRRFSIASVTGTPGGRCSSPFT